MESQLKNLLFNLVLKDGQNSIPALNLNSDHNKERNDMLAIIASSLNKIEGHLNKISKVASSLLAQNVISSQNDNGSISTPVSLNMNSSNNNNEGTNNNNNTNTNNTNSVIVTRSGSTNVISNQGGNEA